MSSRLLEDDDFSSVFSLKGTIFKTVVAPLLCIRVNTSEYEASPSFLTSAVFRRSLMNSVKSPASAFVQNVRSKSIPVLASRGLSFSFLGVEAIKVKFDSTLVFATSSSSSLKLILSLRRDNLFSFPFSSLIAKRDDFFGLNHSTTPFTNPPMTFCFRSRSLRWFVFSPRGFGRGRGT